VLCKSQRVQIFWDGGCTNDHRFRSCFQISEHEFFLAKQSWMNSVLFDSTNHTYIHDWSSATRDHRVPVIGRKTPGRAETT
jgi:hypothetical protein